VGLTTALDLATLSSLNWLIDYANNKTAFNAVGKVVYQVLMSHSGSAPTGPHMLEQPLMVALQVNNTFKAVCASKAHINPIMYPTFALALARYILDNEWTDITSP
jgi:hypothetical protein